MANSKYIAFFIDVNDFLIPIAHNMDYLDKDKIEDKQNTFLVKQKWRFHRTIDASNCNACRNQLSSVKKKLF